MELPNFMPGTKNSNYNKIPLIWREWDQTGVGECQA